MYIWLFSPSLVLSHRHVLVRRSRLPSSRLSLRRRSIACALGNISEKKGSCKMSAMLLNVVAASVLVFASTVTATYQVGPWLSAHATYYGSDTGEDSYMGGSCGYNDVFTGFYSVYTAALSNVLFQQGERCGACFELQCMQIPEGPLDGCLTGKSVMVTATNYCQVGRQGGWCDGPLEHFDLSVPAFTSIAQKDEGLVPVEYRRVPCRKQGGIRFLLKGNPYSQLVLIYNVGGAGDIQSASIKGDSTAWLPAGRQYGENWQFGGPLVGQVLSFSVTTFDNATVVSCNITNRDWQYGMTFVGSQFS